MKNKIKKLRIQKGLTQKQLGEEIGVSKQAISNWERGKNSTDIDTLRLLAKFFEVSVEELIEPSLKEDDNINKCVIDICEQKKELFSILTLNDNEDVANKKITIYDEISVVPLFFWFYIFRALIKCDNDETSLLSKSGLFIRNKNKRYFCFGNIVVNTISFIFLAFLYYITQNEAFIGILFCFMFGNQFIRAMLSVIRQA